MRLAAVAELDGEGRPDLALPDARRTALRLVSFAGGRVRELASLAMPESVVGPVLVDGTGAGTRVIMRLGDGSLVRLARR